MSLSCHFPWQSVEKNLLILIEGAVMNSSLKKIDFALTTIVSILLILPSLVIHNQFPVTPLGWLIAISLISGAIVSSSMVVRLLIQLIIEAYMKGK